MHKNVAGLKPRHSWRHFWHPKNPPIKAGVRPNFAL